MRTHSRFLVSHYLLGDPAYADPMREWLGPLLPGSLLILDEAHHAAPSSGGRYGIETKFTRSVRDLGGRFEHRLFLSATPHNGHSNSFSTLLELLDPYRFTRGVKVGKKALEEVMVRRLKEDIREIQGGFPKRIIERVLADGLPEDAPELTLSRLLDEYRTAREERFASTSGRTQAAAGLLVVGLQQRLLSSIEAFARSLTVHRRTVEREWEAGATTTTVADGKKIHPLPEYGGTLAPDYAVRERDPGEGARAWQLLVSVLAPGRDLDHVEREGGRLEASAQGRMERLLRETGVMAGLSCKGRVLRLISAPRGESSGWLQFRVAEMVQTAGRPIVAAMRLLLSQPRLLTLPRSQRLAALLQDSRRFQNEVSEKLAEQVLHALYELLRGLQAAQDSSGGEPLREPGRAPRRGLPRAAHGDPAAAVRALR